MEPLQKYYILAIQHLTRRPRSEKELREFLEKKAKTLKRNTSEYMLSPEILDAIITKLKAQKFLNDFDFAVWWRDQRTRFRQKSDSVIKMELKQKGVTQDIIEEVFMQSDEDTLSDSEKARQLVEKRFSKVKDLPKQEQYQKLGGFLARRGYSWSVSKRAIDDIRTKSYNNS